MGDDEDSFVFNQELDYDMWEGQFEFIGPEQGVNVVPHGLLSNSSFNNNNNNNGLKNGCKQLKNHVRKLKYCIFIIIYLFN